MLRAKTETSERALDAVLAEDERNRLANQADERFLRSGIVIKESSGHRTNGFSAFLMSAV